MWFQDKVSLYGFIILCAYVLQTNSQGFGGPFSSLGFNGRGTPDDPFTFVGNSDFGRNIGTRTFGTQPQIIPGLGVNGGVGGFGSSQGFGIPTGFGNPLAFGGATPGFANPGFVNVPQIPFAAVPGVTPPISSGTLSATENSVTSRFTNNGIPPTQNVPTAGSVVPQQTGLQNQGTAGQAVIPVQGNNQIPIGLPAGSVRVPTGSVGVPPGSVRVPTGSVGLSATGVGLPVQGAVLPTGGVGFPTAGVGLPMGGVQRQPGFIATNPGAQTVAATGNQFRPISPNTNRPPQIPNVGCQARGCRSGEHCTFGDRFVCPDWIPTLRCRCMEGCRVMNTFIPKNTAMRMDTCGNTCTCLRNDGVAACTVLDCQGVNGTAPSGERAPIAQVDPLPTVPSPATAAATSSVPIDTAVSNTVK